MSETPEIKRPRLKRDWTAIHKARDEAFAKAPRTDDGKLIPDANYKNILDQYKDMGREPKVLKDEEKVTRPPKFLTHPELADRIVRNIRRGIHYTTVCRLVGISRETFLKWLKLGSDGHHLYKNFYQRVVNAEATAELRLLNVLQSHEKFDWRVSAWQLERRWPEHWAKRDGVRAELKVNGDVSVTHKHQLGIKVLESPAMRELARQVIDGTEFGYTSTEPTTEAQEVDE